MKASITTRAICLTTLFLFLREDAVVCETPATPVVTIQSVPERPIIESRNGNLFLNFDLVIRAQSRLTLRVSQIELSVYDATDRLVLRKSLNTDAFAPSIAVIGKEILEPGKSLDVFNPFSEFEANVPLERLEYSLCLLRESTPREAERNRHRLPDDCDFREKMSVAPRRYEGRTPLVLPLRGRIFVWEGHDFYAHHLRVPMSDRRVQALGITANSNEFASDFIYVDTQGQTFHDDPRKLENWYGYNQPIYAPGAGVVLSAVNDIPENTFEDIKATKIGHPTVPAGKDPKDIGNFVLVDHQNGEYSLLVHMKLGSVVVKRGDHVTQGQQIGRIGFAGDSLFPHLHYSLMDGPEVFKAWGLPPYFFNFHRLLGGTSVDVSRGTVDSGDFLETNAVYSEAK